MKLIVGILLAVMVLSLAPAPRTEAHSGLWYVSKSSGTYLRTCPSTSCGKVVLLPKWSEIRLDRHRGTWAYGYVDDWSGWVSLNVVRQVAAPAPPPPPAATGGETCFATTFGGVACAPQWMADEIASAASTYGVSYWALMSVAACESSFDPATLGWAGEVGIFQWTYETWAWIGRGDRYSTYDQIWATAWAFSAGYASHWTCAYRQGVV